MLRQIYEARGNEPFEVEVFWRENLNKKFPMIALFTSANGKVLLNAEKITYIHCLASQMIYFGQLLSIQGEILYHMCMEKVAVHVTSTGRLLF